MRKRTIENTQNGGNMKLMDRFWLWMISKHIIAIGHEQFANEIIEHILKKKYKIKDKSIYSNVQREVRKKIYNVAKLSYNDFVTVVGEIMASR